MSISSQNPSTIITITTPGPQGPIGAAGPSGSITANPTFTSITASGDISASGHITAQSASFTHLTGNSPLIINGLVDFQAEVTSSAGVSASFGRLRVLENTEFDTGIRNFYVDDVDGADIYQRIGTTTLNNLVLESSIYNTSVVSSHTASLLGQVTNVGATLGINVTRSINLGVNNTVPAFNNLWNIYLGGGQSDTKLFIQSPTTQVTGTLFSGSAATTASFGHYMGDGFSLENSSLKMVAPNGTVYKFTVDNNGHLQLTGSAV